MSSATLKVFLLILICITPSFFTLHVSSSSIEISESGFAFGYTSPQERALETKQTSGSNTGSTPATYESGCGGTVIATLKAMAFAGCWTGMIVAFGGFILTLAGGLFDIFIALTLSPDRLSEQYISTAWSSMRDLANLTFIFGMIAVGFMMILGGQIGNWKDTLKRLIIVAFMLNFSLFFSRVVIDAGNIMGHFFYNQAVPSGTAVNALATAQLQGLTPANSESTPPPVLGVSQQIISKLNLMTLLGGETGSGLNVLSNNGNNQTFFFMFNVSFLVIALVGSYSLATTGFLFLSRTIYLIILMIVSPLAFAAYFLPNGQGLAKKWFIELLNKSFCVAVYLFFIYLLITIMGSMNSGITVPTGKAENQFTEALLKVTILLTFVFGILGFANKQAKKMCEGEKGGIGSVIMKAAGSAAVLATTGGAGLAARATIGRAGRNIANSAGVSGLASSKSRFKRLVGNTLYSVGETAQNAKFGRPEGYTKSRVAKSKIVMNRADIHSKNNKAAYKEDEKNKLWENLSASERRTRIETEFAKPGASTLDPAQLKKKAQEQMALDKQDQLNEAVTQRSKVEAKAIIDKGVGSGWNWVLQGGVDAHKEASDSYKIIDEGDERKKRRSAQQVADKQRMGTAMGLEINELDRLGDTVSSSLANGEFALDSRTINQLDDHQDFKALTNQLAKTMTANVRDKDGNVQQTIDTASLNTATIKLKEDLGRVGDRFNPELQKTKTEMEAAKRSVEYKKAQGLSSTEIATAEQEAKEASQLYQATKTEYKKATDSVIERTNNVAKETLKSKLNMEVAMGTASQIQNQDEAQAEADLAIATDSSDVPGHLRRGD